MALLPLPRPLMTGEVLDAAFRLFRTALLSCLPYSGVAVLVLQLPTLYSTLLGGGAEAFVVWRSPVGPLTDAHLVLTCALLLGVLLFGTMTLRLLAVSRGERPRFRRELAEAFHRWPSAVVATLGSLGLPAFLYAFGVVFAGTIPLELLLAIAVPLLFPTAILAVALPAFWSDRLGAFAAILRAMRVSRWQTWRMIGAMAAAICLVLIFYVLSTILVAFILQIAGSADLVLFATVRSLLTLVFGALGVPFVLAVLVVAYEDLKLRYAARRGAIA